MLMSMAVSGPGTRRRRRDERRRETRLLLLQAAALLFARHGYHEVSLDAVAEEAGFTKGAVYSHFSSKQDLLANLLEFYCEQQHSQIRSILAEPAPLDERLRQISTWFFHPPEDLDDWSLLYVELWLQAMREPSLRPRMRQIHQRARQSVAQMIDQEAETRGVTLTVPAEDLAQALLALGDGLMMQHLLTPSARTAQAYRSALHAMLREATRPPDAGPLSPATGPPPAR
jgi:AcrR family transcriptional regulator